MHAHVIQGEPKVGLQLAGLGDTWKELAEDGISLELWDLQQSPECCFLLTHAWARVDTANSEEAGTLHVVSENGYACLLK